MFHAMRNDREFSRSQDEIFVTQLEAQLAFHHEEQLVFPLVMMPHEFALQLHELDQTVVHFAHDLGTPMLLKPAEHVGQIYRAGVVHDARSRTVLVSTTVENSPCRSARATSWTSSAP